MHNANLAFIALELLFNRLPFVGAHFAFVVSAFVFAHRTHFSHMSHPTFPISHLLFLYQKVLWGVYYAFFSWYWLRRTGVCYYPFADPTLPPHISCSLYMGVLAVLSGAFAVGNGVTTLATAAPIPLRLLLVAFGAWNLMWTPLRGVPQPAAYMLAGKS